MAFISWRVLVGLAVLLLADGTRGAALPSASVRLGARAPVAFRRAGAPSCSILGDLAGNSKKTGPPLKVGDTVRVVESSKLMHVPGHRDGFDPSSDGGSVGVVLSMYESGTNLSANRRIKVQFDDPKKWVGHFEPYELQLVSSG